ncbi:hypothetical protein LV779_16450 [Streptomyces thinghirensis]|nr:hypothetical protein [Streptomyces thinghirensis]
MRQREAYAKSLPKGRAKQFKELKIEAILDTPVNIVVTADGTRGGRHTLAGTPSRRWRRTLRARGREPPGSPPARRGPRRRLGQLLRRARDGPRPRPARAPGRRRLPVRRVRRRVPGRARADAGRLVQAPPAVLGRARGDVRPTRPARRGPTTCLPRPSHRSDRSTPRRSARHGSGRSA